MIIESPLYERLDREYGKCNCHIITIRKYNFVLNKASELIDGDFPRSVRYTTLCLGLMSQPTSFSLIILNI